MPANEPWRPIEFAFVFAMWAVMMVGMMTPSSRADDPHLRASGVRRRSTTSRLPQRPGSSAATSWPGQGFSLAATSAQWALERAAAHADDGGASNILGGVVLIVAGLYQWTPFKEACLFHCQSPLTFILRHGGFRGDPAGALALGVRHGIYCIGCCWALMVLLFVGGVMNLFWIAALAFLVLLEKVIPSGRIIARAVGIIFMAGGGWILLQHP